MRSLLIFILAIFAAGAADPDERKIAELHSRAQIKDHVAAVRAIEFSRDGSMLISGDAHGMIDINEPRFGKLIREIKPAKPAGVLTLSLSSDGKLIAAATEDGALRILQIASGQLQREIHVDALTAARFSADDHTLICTRGMLDEKAADQDHVELVSVATGEKTGSIDVDLEFVFNATVSADGKLLALSGGESLTDIPANKGGRTRCRVNLFEIKPDGTGAKFLRSLGEKLSHPILTPTFSATGKLLAGACGDWLVWETAGAMNVATLRATDFRAASCAISPNSHWIAAGAIDSTVTLFNTRTWQPIYQSQADPSMDVNAMQFSPDGSTLAASRGRLIELFVAP